MPAQAGPTTACVVTAVAMSTSVGVASRVGVASAVVGVDCATVEVGVDAGGIAVGVASAPQAESNSITASAGTRSFSFRYFDLVICILGRSPICCECRGVPLPGEGRQGQLRIESLETQNASYPHSVAATNSLPAKD